jgi:hypothetical protein
MLWQRLASRRCWARVALTVVDRVSVIIPMAATALVVCALVAPDLLRRIACFLESVAIAS